MRYFECISSLRLLVFVSAFGVAVAAGNSTPEAAAVVDIDGKFFTAADVQTKSPGAVFQARNALFEAQRKAIDEFVSTYLLEREAKNENLTVEQLLDRHAYSTLAKDPTDEALRVYYDGIDTAEPFEAVREKILDVVRQRRMAKAKSAYVQSLRSRAAIKVLVAPPRLPVSAGNAPVRGPADAPVTIVEYADYECPYCQQIQPVVERIEKEYRGKIAFVFKDVPLPMHANAQKAAEAAHCAREQGKFWEYHDRLFSTAQLAPSYLKEHSRALALDAAAFDRCLDSGSQADRIKAQITEAQSIALPGTPGFFVNGRFLSGAIDYETIRKAVEEELGNRSSSEKRTARVRED